MSQTPRRVIVFRGAGRTARMSARDVASQLRAVGYVALELEPPRTDFLFGTADQGRRLTQLEQYDLVVLIGRLSPAAIAISVQAGAPIADVTNIDRECVAGAVEHALHQPMVTYVPAARVTLGNNDAFTIGPVRLESAADMAVTISGAVPPSQARRAATCDVQLVDQLDGLRVTVGTGEPFVSHRLSACALDGSIRVVGHRDWKPDRRVTITAVLGGIQVLQM